jgi:hypothetical protein
LFALPGVNAGSKRRRRMNGGQGIPWLGVYGVLSNARCLAISEVGRPLVRSINVQSTHPQLA